MVCSFLHSFCEENGINAVPVTAEVNEWRTRIKNTREGPGATAKQLLHYAQLISTGKFTQFDYYSDKENKKRYGTKKPPSINLDNIPDTKVPIAMFVGEFDPLAEEEDTRALAQ